MNTIEHLIQSTMDTNDFARILGQRSQSIRKAYAMKGTVMGIRPVKLPNGKLRWPTDSVARLMKGEAA
ncbi:hypothetical protein ABEV37_06850 [Chromobacterium piscinae]|uniref:DNA-binding protein n=1 Tax=Chromobacterium violaceum TaxID=536 RepID=UPI0015FAE3BD|nr:DNA-binding protein [Chromobacterium violaceum]